MKIFIFMIVALLNLKAGLVNDGVIAFHNGDKKTAVKLWKEACDKGSVGGCYNLGGMYYNGHGIRQDKKIAKKLFKKVCDEGVALGCKNYELMNKEEAQETEVRKAKETEEAYLYMLSLSQEAGEFNF